MREQNWDDNRIELIIGTLLRVGVLVATAVVVIGAVFYLARHGCESIHVKTFRGQDAYLRTLPGILRGAIHGTPRAMMQLGLLLLVATPVTRVLFSAIAFALERDYLYVGLTLAVLTILAYSLFGSALS